MKNKPSVYLCQTIPEDVYAMHYVCCMAVSTGCIPGKPADVRDAKTIIQNTNFISSMASPVTGMLCVFGGIVHAVF